MQRTPPASLTLEAHLIEDLRDALLARLLAEGYAVPEALHADASSVVECYFTTLRRRVSEQPRRVHVARRRFYVPAVAAEAFAGIVRRIENGGELTPFLSRGVLPPASVDQLLYEWGIHHLHISPRGDAAFAKRSDHVLLARFTAEDAYLISVRRHPHDEEWSRAELLHRVHEEWPESIWSYRARGFRPDDEDTGGTTDETVVAMRKKNLSYLFWTADGVGYLPPGGGMMSSGLSADVRIAADHLMDRVQQWQEKHVSDPTELQRLAQKHGRKLQGTVRLSLELDGDDIFALWAEGAMRFAGGNLPTCIHG